MIILFKVYDAMMPGVEIIDTICEVCTPRGLVYIQDYFVYLEVVLKKEPSTLLSFVTVLLSALSRSHFLILLE